MILQNIWMKFVGSILINLSNSNIFQNCHSAHGHCGYQWDKIQVIFIDMAVTTLLMLTWMTAGALRTLTAPT